MLELRNYQLNIIHEVHKSMEAGNRKPLVVLPTGAGKTVCFAWMADKTQQKGNVVWFLVHRRELMDQTTETFDRFNISRESIHIGMVGQISNNAKKFPKPDFIIFDEGHHAAARTWKRILEKFPDVFVIGLTATPSRLDGKPLGAIYDDLIIGPSTADLIEKGDLARYRYITSEISLAGLGYKMGDYDLSKAASLLMERHVYGDVIDTYRQYANNKQSIYFCSSIAHSEAMADEFNAAGVAAAHFDGTTPKQKRKDIVSRFRLGEIRVLTNVDLIGEGFDMPSCDCVGMLRPTQSLTIFLQQSGRALRPATGKTAVLIDHVGNVNRHGLPSDARIWSLTDKVKTGRQVNDDGQFAVRRCADCFAVFPATQANCPNCGCPYEPEPVEIRRMEHIQMVELEQKQKHRELLYLMTPGAINEAKNYSDFCRIASARGYKSGWAYYQAKQRGMWVPSTRRF